MIVLPTSALREMMTNIVNASHALVNTAGTQVSIPTIAEPQLRMAALVALEIALGETIWPGDRKIQIERPKRSHDIFEEV
jgi:hypothetical protein